jgi:hypothetical protein
MSDDFTGMPKPMPNPAALVHYFSERGGMLHAISAPTGFVCSSDWAQVTCTTCLANQPDDRAHSRACGIRCPGHGKGCAKDCPTCHGGPMFDPGPETGLPGFDGVPERDPMPEDLPDKVLAELDGYADMTETERLALMVAAVAGKLEERAHLATQMCATLEGQNAEALRHLQAMVAVAHAAGTTYAADTDALEAATAFLEDVGSPETPDQPTEDH